MDRQHSTTPLRIVAVSVAVATTMKYLASAVLLATIVASLSDAATLEFEESKSCKDCDEQSTCCVSAADATRCCPIKNAVCCSDGQNCCPSGTRCNIQQQTCDRVSSNVTRPAVRKQQPASDATSPLSPDNMVCPDRSQCPQPGAACCRQYSNRYGCCNYPLNVCCDDGIHCCHTGSVCDQLRLLCIPYPPAQSQPWTKTVESHKSVAEAEVAEAVAVQAVDETSNEVKDKAGTVCPDGSQCPDGNTCCRTYAGYGCCPYSRATCCSDLAHCCPYGYLCTSSGSCVRSSEANVPWAAMNAPKP